jgi:hypothetical protein
MGSVAKAVKKVTKRVSRPISKITKGIAKGIVKVGKATMRGVAKIQNKLGPLGSIAMAIAMPYALSGLSNIVGHAGMAAGQSSGLLGSSNVFLNSIGTVGNAIRTGYQGVTGFVGRQMSGITKSITKGFSDMGKGNNIFARISRGAKDLFTKSRAAAQKFKPFTAKTGSVEVSNFGNPFGYSQSTTMTSGQAGQLLSDGIISGDQLSNQAFSKTGWLTKANPMDKAVTEAINTTYEKNIMAGFDSTAKRAFLDYKAAADASGVKYNYQNINSMMKDNLTFDGTPDGMVGFDFSKSGDYGIGTTQPGQATEYAFNGSKSFKTNNGISTLTKIKKAASSKALDALKNNLLSPSSAVPIQDFTGLMGDATQQTSGNTMYGGTNIHGSSGGSLLEGTFNKAQQEQIMTYYKNMNIIGSQ